MIDALAFERKVDQLHGQEVETPTVEAARKRWEPMVNAIVVRVLAGNGDGVRAGALGDLTERSGRPFASRLIYQTKIAWRLRRQKKPRQSHRGRVGARKPVRTPEYDGARIVRAPSVP
jgi:hypothetical protein